MFGQWNNSYVGLAWFWENVIPIGKWDCDLSIGEPLPKVSY